MTTLPLIKTGALVFIRVWPIAQLYLANGRPYGSFKEWEQFEAYGYREISHFFADTDDAFVSIKSDNGEFPVGGIIIDAGGHDVRRKMAKYTIARFYHILAEGMEKPLWFPESDVTQMTREAYEAMKDKHEEIL